MPLIPGQGTGLMAGIVMLVLFSAIYFVMRYRISTLNKTTVRGGKKSKPSLLTEFSEEITPDKEENKDNLS
jgi:hypothetical protein